MATGKKDCIGISYTAPALKVQELLFAANILAFSVIEPQLQKHEKYRDPEANVWGAVRN